MSLPAHEPASVSTNTQTRTVSAYRHRHRGTHHAHCTSAFNSCLWIVYGFFPFHFHRHSHTYHAHCTSAFFPHHFLFLFHRHRHTHRAHCPSTCRNPLHLINLPGTNPPHLIDLQGPNLCTLSTFQALALTVRLPVSHNTATHAKATATHAIATATHAIATRNICHSVYHGVHTVRAPNCQCHQRHMQ